MKPDQPIEPVTPIPPQTTPPTAYIPPASPIPTQATPTYIPPASPNVQPLVTSQPAYTMPEPAPKQFSSKLILAMVAIVVVGLVIAALAVALVLTSRHKSSTNMNNTTSSAGGSTTTTSSGSSQKTEAYSKYTNSQFGISFSYPAAWGSISMSQTTGQQDGASGISSYDATFSNKTGGTDYAGVAQPYLFRINSFKWSAPVDSDGEAINSPSLTYRLIAVGKEDDNPEVGAGLNTCERNSSSLSEVCGNFSQLGDWTTVKDIVVAKQSYDAGVGMFVPLAPLSGDNYTMVSFYSSSKDDYNQFIKIAQSFTGQHAN